jgi:hypothetical protein
MASTDRCHALKSLVIQQVGTLPSGLTLSPTGGEAPNRRIHELVPTTQTVPFKVLRLF